MSERSALAEDGGRSDRAPAHRALPTPCPCAPRSAPPIV